jgi:hypothetical protein
MQNSSISTTLGRHTQVARICHQQHPDVLSRLASTETLASNLAHGPLIVRLSHNYAVPDDGNERTRAVSGSPSRGSGCDAGCLVKRPGGTYRLSLVCCRSGHNVPSSGHNRHTTGYIAARGQERVSMETVCVPASHRTDAPRFSATMRTGTNVLPSRICAAASRS